MFVAQVNEQAKQIIPLNEPQALQFLAQLHPPGSPGSDRLRARFSVDDRRRLRVTVIDLQTEKTLLENVVVAHAALGDEFRHQEGNGGRYSTNEGGLQRASQRAVAGEASFNIAKDKKCCQGRHHRHDLGCRNVGDQYVGQQRDKATNDIRNGDG